MGKSKEETRTVLQQSLLAAVTFGIAATLLTQALMTVSVLGLDPVLSWPAELTPVEYLGMVAATAGVVGGILWLYYKPLHEKSTDAISVGVVAGIVTPAAVASVFLLLVDPATVLSSPGILVGMGMMTTSLFALFSIPAGVISALVLRDVAPTA